MIEMFRDLIAGLLGLIRRGELDKASESIGDLYFTFLKQDASFFHMIPTEKLTDELIHIHNHTNQHLEILSELMFAEAELNNACGNIKLSLEFYKKSLFLSEFVDKAAGVYFEEKQAHMKEIKMKIKELEHKIT